MNLLGWIRERYHPLWHLRQQAWFRRMQKRFDFPVRRRYRDGIFYGLFIRDFSVLAQPSAGEAETFAVVDELLQAGLVTHFFDLGANIGLVSCHVLSIAADTEVFLFEPDPVNIGLLRKTIRANGWRKVHLWEGVISGQLGSREFLVDEASGATGSLSGATMVGSPLQSAYHMERRIQVASTTLDAYAEVISPAAAKILLKIDVEGAEVEVFAGGWRFIERHRPIIIIECFYPENLQPLVEKGYRLRALDKNRNYLLLPEEMGDQIEKILVPVGASSTTAVN